MRERLARSAFSPDGRWIAYQSNEGGANRVWVQPFPPTGAEYPVVNGGQPFWSGNSEELFYNAGPGGIISMVNITSRPAFAFSDCVAVPNKGLTGLSPSTFPRNIDIAADGQRFVGVVTPDQSQAPNFSTSPIQVVLNWFGELRQRAPVK